MTITLRKSQIENFPIICFLMLLWRQDYVNLLSAIFGISSSLVMAVWYGIAAVLFFVYLFNFYNCFINYRGYFILLLMLAIYTISLIIVPNESANQFFEDFLLYACIEAIYASQIRNYDQALKLFCISAFITFIICGFLPFSGGLEHYSDMPFYGTGMVYGENLAVPCFIGLYIYRKKYNSRKLLVFEIICLILMFVLANRSSLLVVVFIVAIYNIFIEKSINGRRLAYFIIALILALIVILNLTSILTWINNLLYNIGIYSYSVAKYSEFLINGGDFSIFGSGRNEISALAWNYFNESPIFGIGIGTFDTETIYPYAHNIFTDWFSTLGIIGGTMMLLLTVIAIINFFRCKTSDKKIFFLILFAMWFPRLLFSKSFVNDVSYWTFMVFAFSLSKFDFQNEPAIHGSTGLIAQRETQAGGGKY